MDSCIRPVLYGKLHPRVCINAAAAELRPPRFLSLFSYSTFDILIRTNLNPAAELNKNQVAKVKIIYNYIDFSRSTINFYTFYYFIKFYYCD